LRRGRVRDQKDHLQNKESVGLNGGERKRKTQKDVRKEGTKIKEVDWVMGHDRSGFGFCEKIN